MKDLQQLTRSQKEALYCSYQDVLTAERIALFERLIENRTRQITVVLEDIYQDHNASAVMRTCDCFGIQDLHVIESRNAYQINSDIAVGSSKWVSLHRYQNTLTCYDILRQRGYKIIATLPHENDTLLDDLNVEQKIALVFGTEKLGLSQQAMEHADGFVKIPMYGFTESLNVSVSAALSVYHLTEKMRRLTTSWELSPEEQTETKLQWARQTVKNPETLEMELLRRLDTNL